MAVFKDLIVAGTSGPETKRKKSQESSLEVPSSYRQALKNFFTPSPVQSNSPSGEVRINLAVTKLENLYKTKIRIAFAAICDLIGSKIQD